MTMSMDFVTAVVWTGILDSNVTAVRIFKITKSNAYFLKIISNNYKVIFFKLRIWSIYIFILIFEACQSGYYGANCSLACAPNCKTCRHTDGLCSCKAGWKGHNCSIGKWSETLFFVSVMEFNMSIWCHKSYESVFIHRVTKPYIPLKKWI